jgi:hypothetical protein
MPLDFELTSRRTNQVLRREEDLIHDDLRKLYESLDGVVGNFIPLSGTEENVPVTGDIRVSKETGFINIYAGDLTDVSMGLRIDEENETVGLFKTREGDDKVGVTVNDVNVYVNFYESGEEIDFHPTDGITPSFDFSESVPQNRLVVAQRKNVDIAMSYSTDETATGGTWIDGKPIYRKVIQYDVATDMQTGSGNSAIELENTIENVSNFNLIWKEEGLDVKWYGSFANVGGGLTYATIVSDSGITVIQFANSAGSAIDLDFAGIEYIRLTIEYTKTTDV